MMAGNEVAAGEVLTVSELVAYQPGAVVSRTLVHKKGGTVTVFAFDQGEGLSEHTTPFEAVVQIVEGEAQITISGVARSVGAGQVILLPANEPHAVEAVTQMKMLLVMARE